MIEFGEFIAHLQQKLNIDSASFRQDIVAFLVDNDWFGIIPEWVNGKMLVEPSDFDEHMTTIMEFYQYKDMSVSGKADLLLKRIRAKFPETSDLLEKFYHATDSPVEAQYALNAFLLKYLKCDARIVSDTDLERLVQIASDDMQKAYSENFRQ